MLQYVYSPPEPQFGAVAAVYPVLPEQKQNTPPHEYEHVPALFALTAV